MAFFEERYLIIDYGNALIKGVLIEKGFGKRKVLRVESLPTVRLERADLSGENRHKEEYEYNLVRFIQSFFPEEQNYLLNLRPDAVYVRDVVIPVDDIDQAAEILPGEVENMVPVSLDEAECIGQPWNVDEEGTHFIAFTAEHTAIRNAVEPLISADTSVRMLAAEPVSLAGAIRMLDPYDYERKLIGQIDIGYTTTTINLLLDGELCFTRQLPSGVEEIDQIFLDAGVDEEQLHTVRETVGLSVRDDSTEPGSFQSAGIRLKSGTVQKASAAAREFLDWLAGEVERSVLAARAGRPAGFYLSGGGALIDGIDSYLEQKLEWMIRFYPIEINGKPATLWIQALGTAENADLKPKERIDFLNTPFGSTLKRGELNLNVFSTPLLISASAILVILISFIVGILLDKRQIAAYRTEAARIAAEIPGLPRGPELKDPVEAARKLCRERLQAVESQLGGHRSLDVLKEITDNLPPPSEADFRMKSFRYDGAGAQIQLIVDGLSGAAIIERQLKQSKMFQSVENVRSDSVAGQKVRLTLKLGLKPVTIGQQVNCR